jgi:Mn2+/Fe2+ NRAMP family transporter
MAVAIPLGGVISMAILVVGTAVEGPLTFEALSRALEGRLGNWAGVLFAVGLFAAGFSSALTAPLAAALSIRGLAARENDVRWRDRGWRFRSVWAAVLATGLGFGLAGVKPIPAILLAQALNGAILPVVAIFLFLAVNNPRIMGAKALSGTFANVIMGFSVIVAVLLGTTGILKAAYSVLSLDAPGEGVRLVVAGAVALLIAVPVVKRLRAQRHPGSQD